MQLKADKPGVSEVAPQKAPAHRDRIALGMAAAVASFFLLNTMNVFAKLLSPAHSVIEVAFYRNAIAAAPFAVWIFLLGRRDLLKINSRLDAIVLRSVFGTVSLIATFKAFNFLPMADAQALFFTSSLFLPVMGWLFLKERVGQYRWSAVLIGFLGMLVIVRPTGDVNMTGITFAVSAALLHASLGTLLRVLGRTERPETVTFYFLVIGTAMTGLAMPFVGTIPHWNEAPLFIGGHLRGLGANLPFGGFQICAGRARHDLQLHGHRLGDGIWLVHMGRLARAARLDRGQYHRRLEPLYRLARKPDCEAFRPGGHLSVGPKTCCVV